MYSVYGTTSRNLLNLTKKKKSFVSMMDLSENSWAHERRLKLFLANKSVDFFYLVNKVESNTSVKTNTKKETINSRTIQ